MEKPIREEAIEFKEDGKVLGRLLYRKGNGSFEILSTYVDPAARGRGIAGILMEMALEQAKETGLKIVSHCSYASAYLDKRGIKHG